MFKVNTLINLSVLILGMILLPQIAFSETRQGASSVTELIKKDTKVGTGEEATIGKAVEVHYTGWLTMQALLIKRGRNLIAPAIVAPLFHFSSAQGA